MLTVTRRGLVLSGDARVTLGVDAGRGLVLSRRAHVAGGVDSLRVLVLFGATDVACKVDPGRRLVLPGNMRSGLGTLPLRLCWVSFGRPAPNIQRHPRQRTIGRT